MKHAFENGRSWYQDIAQLVAALENDDERENAEQQIQEGPLSVMVRDGWHMPGGDTCEGPEEYEILLSTGGPALRLYGKIGDHNEPVTAELQAQDWGTPWTCVPDCDEEVLLAYAQQFYFG
jgi:hypothetical protein